MKRRTLDILFSSGGMVFAALLLILGVVLAGNARFANDYVRDQLSDQRITFKAEEALTDEERQSACVVENAGQLLTTGKQAECYANEFIGLHLQSTADGMTFAELGAPQAALRAEVAEAREAGNPELPEIEEQLAEIDRQRDTLFRGETLRGLLLTSFGFSEFGVKADQAGKVAFGGAALLFLLSIAGFVHAFRTPKSEVFASPEPDERMAVEKEPAKV